MIEPGSYEEGLLHGRYQAYASSASIAEPTRDFIRDLWREYRERGEFIKELRENINLLESN